MKQYTLVNWSTKEELIIIALYCEANPKTYVWEIGIYDEEDNKVLQKSFNTRYWDIREIKQLSK